MATPRKANPIPKQISGRLGGEARARKLTKKRRRELASQAGKALWRKIRAGLLKDPAA